MELSENTLSVLKNFANINPNIMIREGTTIKSMSEARNVLSRAEVNESFPKDVGIYDLNEFINVLSLVDTPRLKFEDEYASISDSTGRSKVKYFFSPEETLTTPQKDVTMPNVDVSFTLTNETLNKLKRAASVLGHEEVSICGKDGVISLSILDNKNSTSNTFSIDVDGSYPDDAVFNFIINIANLKILPGDYIVGISSKLISEFKHAEMNVQYWIALEKSSTYGV